MSMTNAAETAILELILNNAAWANIGDASGLQPSAADGNLFVSLHTADPTEAGDQTSNEANYGSYARVGVTRDGTGWTVTGPSAENDADVEFPQAASGSNTITHFGIGTASSGAGNLLLSGTCSLVVSTGITPRFPAGALTVTAE